MSEVRIVETMSAEVGMFVMNAIILNSIIASEDANAIAAQKNVIKAEMAKLDSAELSEAMYFYEKATGKFDPEKTYMR